MRGMLCEEVIVDRVMNAVADGATLQNSAGVQLGAGDSVQFIVLHGSITAAPTCHVEQSDDDGSTDGYSDLAGTNVAIAATDDNKCTVICVRRPRKKWVRVVVDRTAGNSVIDGVLALIYDCKEKPVTQSADVAGIEKHLAPAEGTI